MDTLLYGEYRSHWMFGFPFLVAVLVSAASIRLTIFGRFSLMERVIAYCVSIVTLGFTLFFSTKGMTEGGWPPGADLFGAPVSPRVTAVLWVTAVLGTSLVARNCWSGVPQALVALMAMQMAYLTNGLFCLIVFAGAYGWEIGAFLTAATVAIYVAHILVASASGKTRASDLRSGSMTAG